MVFFNLEATQVAELPETVELAVKNTFIHFDGTDSESEGEETLSSRKDGRQATCPDPVQRRAFRTKTGLRRRQQAKLELHQSGNCKPCCFFAFKADGCRHGDDCEYCHFCTRRDIRRWKKSRRNLQTTAELQQLASNNNKGDAS